MLYDGISMLLPRGSNQSNYVTSRASARISITFAAFPSTYIYTYYIIPIIYNYIPHLK